jgi:rRNA maturation endonuclease Nob1
MADEPNRVEINEVRTDVVITEGVGPLSRADVQRLVSLVLEHVRREQEMSVQRANDTSIENRVFPPHVR